MNIKSAKFIKGVTGRDEIFEDDKPQIVFIGRSNAGKSSIINSLTSMKGLARTSSFPGLTQQINVFLINNSTYLIDLPGYGFARASKEVANRLHNMINWFLFDSGYEYKKVVLIVDANVGPTDLDLEMFDCLVQAGKDIIILANKVDKIRKIDYEDRIEKIKQLFKGYLVIPHSIKDRTGAHMLYSEIFN